MAEDNSISLIFDTGSFHSRAGYATDDFPRVVYPSIYGYPRSEIDPNPNPALNYYGKNALQHSASLTLNEIFPDAKEPMNWDLYEAFIHTVISDELQIEQLERPVLTNFYQNSGKEIREKDCQLFFENFGASSYFSVSTGLLGLYSSGRLNGVVLDAGHRQTSVTPVIDGSPLLYASVYSSFGGRDITQFLQTKLNLSRELARHVKETYCISATDYDRESGEYRTVKSSDDDEVTLPDGTKIPDGRQACAIASEAPYRPSVIGSIAPGIQEMIFASLTKTDFDLRRELAGNIIFTGGASCFGNFTDRMQKELSLLVPSLLKAKVLNFPDKTMALAAWNGGAIISSVGTFQTMWITRSEYEDYGPSITLRKCM